MSCDDRRDLFLLYVADALDDDERARLDDHLERGCPRCNAHLAEARTVFGHLPLALQPVPPPAQVRDRLVRRVAGEERDNAFRAQPPGWIAGWARPLVAAALAAGVMFVLVVQPMQRRQRRLDAELIAQRDTITSLQGDLVNAMNTLRVLESPQLELTLLASGGPQPAAKGHILRDEANGIWQLSAFDLDPLGTDRTYQLWFITDRDEKISAGTFDVGTDGVATHRVTVPADLEGIIVAAVTDEPAGGSAQPTGQIQLVAEL